MKAEGTDGMLVLSELQGVIDDQVPGRIWIRTGVGCGDLEMAAVGVDGVDKLLTSGNENIAIRA